MSHSLRDAVPGWLNRATTTESEYHDLLTAERRRLLLDVLLERPPPVDLETVAEGIAEREDDSRIYDDTVEAISVALHHVHLPKFVDAGVLEYDTSTNRIVASNEPFPV